MNQDILFAKRIAASVKERGGDCYYVGGYVRDLLFFGEQCQEKDDLDVDIEIHGITREQLTDLLQEFGEIVDTGAEFGVYGLKDHHLDIALPRTERAVGKGHRDFIVTVDPFLGTYDAVARRDFTINALMKNVLTGEIVDHHQGLDDLKRRVIRHVNDGTFAEDPLRLFRGAQFAARFDGTVAEETLALCRDMDVTTLPKERVYGELKKALLKAKRPSIFFEELRKMNQLSVWFPELEQLIGLEQNPEYHGEGDVWNHTMLILDEAAKKREKVRQPLHFMLAALTHDFGKYPATEIINGMIHAYGHEEAGLPLVETFLDRISGERAVVEYVLNMVRYHMKPHQMADCKSSIKKTNHLFDSSVEPYDLIQLAEADNRASLSGQYICEEKFLLERLAVYEEYMARPYVMGRDLKDAGLPQGAYYKDVLEYAHKMRLAGVPKADALKQTLSYAKQYIRRIENE